MRLYPFLRCFASPQEKRKAADAFVMTFLKKDMEDLGFGVARVEATTAMATKNGDEKVQVYHAKTARIYLSNKARTGGDATPAGTSVQAGGTPSSNGKRPVQKAGSEGTQSNKKARTAGGAETAQDKPADRNKEAVYPNVVDGTDSE